MTYRYAIIDEQNNCVGFAQSQSEIKSGNYIEVQVGFNPYGMKYENGEWVEFVEEEVDPEPTGEELYQAEMLLMQSEIIANQNEQDEVLAEILLNQMGV